MASIFKITKSKGEITIKAKIKDLVEVAETHPEYPFTVLNESKFAAAVVGGLKSFANQNDVEKGSTRLQETFESILENISYSGADFIEEMETH